MKQERDREVASVRFSGSVRDNGGPAEDFAEIWNLVKLRNGGWLLAGIQQVAQP